MARAKRPVTIAGIEFDALISEEHGYAEPVIEDRLAKQICRVVWETGLTLHEREELFLDTIRDDTLPEHIMSAKDCAYIFDVCAAGRVEDAREMLGRFVTAQAAK